MELYAARAENITAFFSEAHKKEPLGGAAKEAPRQHLASCRKTSETRAPFFSSSPVFLGEVNQAESINYEQGW